MSLRPSQSSVLKSSMTMEMKRSTKTTAMKVEMKASKMSTSRSRMNIATESKW